MPGAAATPASLAKAALRRLALERQEPTPDRFAAAYAREAAEAGQTTVDPSSGGRLDAAARRVLDRLALRAGLADPEARQRLGDALATGRAPDAQRIVDALPDEGDDGVALADLIGRLMRGLETGGRQWTRARRRDSLQRVLDGSRSDVRRLQARLTQLVASWQEDAADAPAATEATTPDPVPAPTPVVRAVVVPVDGSIDVPPPWTQITDALGATVGTALPTGSAAGDIPGDGRRPGAGDAAFPLSSRLAASVQALHEGPPTAAAAAAIASMCEEADRLLRHRQHLLDQLGRLCHELTDGLVDLSEDEGWARGQCEAMRTVLDGGLSARGVRSVSELLRATRERQSVLRAERERARDALKDLIQRLLGDLGELGEHTDRFRDRMDRHADAVEAADSLESLAGVVREMVEDSRTVAGLVGSTQERLAAEHGRAQALTNRVRELEADLRRLSDEVATDQLTQVANRRGLIHRFEQEQAHRTRDGAALAVGLLDIDNFKRLNDELGHAAGDVALRSLAQAIQGQLGPDDLVARFGGEEFVVLLPRSSADDARVRLTRLQRALSGSLFMHESRPVFVTFSAGVTAWRLGESLDAALERADVGLYEAKRTGKNRTCVV